MTKDQERLGQMVIVMVIYRQSLYNTSTYRTLTHVVSKNEAAPILVVYDNSPETQPFEASPGPWKMIYHHDPLNPGVSKAYNEGYKIARKLKIRWLFLVDQDTEFPPDIFLELSKAVEANPELSIFVPQLRDDLGPLSPFLLRRGKGRRLTKLNPGIHALEKFKFINSGLLISVETFGHAGGYDERFPLDYSDIIFIERLIPVASNFFLVNTMGQHHHSSGLDDGEELLARFRKFVRATFVFKDVSKQKINPRGILLPRAIKLFSKTFNPAFLKEAGNILFRKA